MTMPASTLAAEAPPQAARDLLLAAGLALGPMAVTGIARFAYALLLPAMRDDLVWSYTQAGAMNAANGLGYLVGTLLSLRLAGRVDARRTFTIGMLATALTLIASGLVRSFDALMVLRAVTGVSSALVFVSGTALAARIGSARLTPLAIAVYFSGAGLGIVFSGAALPWLFELRGAAAWPLGWLALGSIALLCTAPGALACARLPPTPSARRAATWPVHPLAPSFAAHFLFGAGYIVYMTFVISWLDAHGATAAQVTGVWSVLGVAVLAAPLLWRGTLRGGRGGAPLAAAIAVLAAGAALPLLSTAWPAMVVSAALVGSAVMMPAAASTAFVRRCVQPRGVDAALATFSMVFAAGQCLGPVLAGWVADAAGSLAAALAAAATVLLAAAALALRQREAH
jgi:predicted MFS family arabinose efflux permease